MSADPNVNFATFKLLKCLLPTLPTLSFILGTTSPFFLTIPPSCRPLTTLTWQFDHPVDRYRPLLIFHRSEKHNPPLSNFSIILGTTTPLSDSSIILKITVPLRLIAPSSLDHNPHQPDSLIILWTATDLYWSSIDLRNTTHLCLTFPSSWGPLPHYLTVPSS